MRITLIAKNVCALLISYFPWLSGSLLLKRQGERLQTAESCVSLNNDESHFDATVYVGTPPQAFKLVVDTGSDHLIVKSCACKKKNSQCAKYPNCFATGRGRSKTFAYPPRHCWVESMKVHPFADGQVLAAVTTDMVRVGQATALMKNGLHLMLDQRLKFPQPFEGILGLGMPSWAFAAAGKRSPAGKRESKTCFKELPQFLDVAGVRRFSICFNGLGYPGVMRYEPNTVPKMMKRIGNQGNHWALDLQGIAVGSAMSKVSVCNKWLKKPGQETACGGIPDSGATLLMGPKSEVVTLMIDICQRWPRCSSSVQPSCRNDYAIGFQKLLATCHVWMAPNGWAEIPSIFLHLGGSDGQTETLQLSSWSYITRASNGAGPCHALFGEFFFNTPRNGPVWVLGSPVFYQYQVTFDRKEASIGFNLQKCGTCGQVLTQMSTFVAWPGLRSMSKAPRNSSIDISLPL